MINAVILFHFFKISFLTVPIQQTEFPILRETLTDTSNIPTSKSSYSWVSKKEIREILQVASTTFVPSTFILNDNGSVIEKRVGNETSDSVIFIEKYEYQDGKLVGWIGRLESATCHYKNENMDSIHVINSNNEDSETYYFKIRYDSLKRLSQVDRVTIVPNNNPSPDRRTEFKYSQSGIVSVLAFELSSPSDTSVKTLTMRDGRLFEIVSPTKSNGKEFNRITRFTYPSLTTVLTEKNKKWPTNRNSKYGTDILGRKPAFLGPTWDFPD